MDVATVPLQYASRPTPLKLGTDRYLDFRWLWLAGTAILAPFPRFVDA
jgi:hypothetical protein